ncbi:VanZ family protein [Candidatus Nitrotoga sp. 1052]|uniref:VanZ family protein n=1 Tax=Candidatus Nitrotoga sp. 1052 TaxID=2886964 RepID=UPI001EF62311|nr:VanZ family protein [Candidatus Nitrotoga sp. 1052]CAH1083241.1 VanZ family protein [Candidatus Nitrotoga sp. 1052]
MLDLHATPKYLKQNPDGDSLSISSARFSILALAVAYTLFAIYGSLVPLNFQHYSWQEASEVFKNIRYLILGIGSRADWVANILLFVPLAFVWLGTLWHSTSVAWRIVAMLFVLLACTSLSIAIEFTQIFFPPRTVSLNDIFAEIIGTALGIVLWPVMGMRFAHLVRAIFQGGMIARYAVLIVYALAYAALSLFPYDFLLTYDEWQAHLASDKVGWLFVPSCGGGCMWKLIPEILAFVPLGISGVLAIGQKKRFSLLLAAAVGMLLGVLIEGLQLTIASGISQGASIGTRAVGMMLGVWLAQSAHGVDWHRASPFVRGMLVLGMLPYLIMLTWLSNWFSSSWLGMSEGLVRLGNMHFLPFYYHYYTSEAVALVSLLFQAGLYLPIGAGMWFWHWAGQSGKPKRFLIWPAITAGMLASVVEGGKLFIAGQHPDPTNVLIAAAAALLAYQLLQMLFATPGQTAALMQPVREPTTTVRRPHWSGMLIGTAALCLAIMAALVSPLGPVWVVPLLLAYIVLLWWRPDLWLVWILALLPLLDLTPWSGRLYWTEYDTLLLVTIGVGYLRLRPSAQLALRKPAKLLLALFTLSAVISLGIGIWPLGALDHNAFASYTSSYNALRAAKGLLFALAFIPLLVHEWNEPAKAARRLAFGMTLGLAAEVLYVLWERTTFSGLFNFDTDYRITGSFPGMHIGGAYIEAYLVTALPFVALWAWQQRHMGATVLAAGLYGLGAYSVMVTFSRGGQAAFVLATLIILFGFVRLVLRDRMRSFLGVGAVILIGSVIIAVAWPVFIGKYSQSRLATIKQDIVIRTDHWADALHILRVRDAPIFGVGLGTFPAAYFWDSSEVSRPSTYAFVTQNGNTFLRLGSGETLYVEQPVAIVPEQPYTFSMDLRSSVNNAELTVPICEKALLYSFTCVWTTLQVKGPSGQWGHYEAHIYAKNFGPPNSLFPRPVKLSIYNGRAGTLVDVANVALLDSAGRDLVRNGDFSEGMHHWFFSTDSHLPWHIKNLYIHVLFEQGWLGLICFMALITYVIGRLLPRAWGNEPASLALFTALTAFLVVGLVDSLIDETRLGFLFYLLLIAGLMVDKGSTRYGNYQTGRFT